MSLFDPDSSDDESGAPPAGTIVAPATVLSGKNWLHDDDDDDDSSEEVDDEDTTNAAAVLLHAGGGAARERIGESEQEAKDAAAVFDTAALGEDERIDLVDTLDYDSDSPDESSDDDAAPEEEKGTSGAAAAFYVAGAAGKKRSRDRGMAPPASKRVCASTDADGGATAARAPPAGAAAGEHHAAMAARSFGEPQRLYANARVVGADESQLRDPTRVHPSQLFRSPAGPLLAAMLTTYGSNARAQGAAFARGYGGPSADLTIVVDGHVARRTCASHDEATATLVDAPVEVVSSNDVPHEDCLS